MNLEPFHRVLRKVRFMGKLTAAGLILTLTLGLSFGQTSHPAIDLLPSPTGPFSIGRVSYYWIDSARPEPLAASSPAYRELMVDVWYPADTVGAQPPAPYLPDLSGAEKVVGQDGISKIFSDAYTQILSGRLYTHAQEGAAFARGLKQCPVLIFSHGLGVLKTDYTSEIEDLVSHGYVVGAIAHTYDTKLVSFPDGRVIRFEYNQRQAYSGAEDAAIQYGNERLKVWAADIRFVMDQLTRYNRELDFQAPFGGHLDLSRIAAFGHSDGGRAAALACQTDDRLRACLDMDGVADNLPFYRDVKGDTMKQPFLLFIRPRKPGGPTAADAAKMGYTLDQLKRLVVAVDKKQTDLLTGMPAGSYRVTVATPGITHMSFSDLPMIQSADDETQYENNLLAMKIIRSYTLAFFDETLIKKKAELLGHKSTSNPMVKVEWFPPLAANPSHAGR